MQRLTNYFWPSAEPKPSAEAQKKRVAINKFLNDAQSGIFLVGVGSAVWNGLFSNYTLGIAALGFYLEILASGFYENVKHDSVTAEYIITHGSKFTSYCTMFHAVAKPVVKPIVGSVIDYATENGKKLLLRIDELITVPSDTPSDTLKMK